MSNMDEENHPIIVKAKPDRKRIVVRSNRIPENILNDPGSEIIFL